MEDVADVNSVDPRTHSLLDAELPYTIELELTVKDRDTIAELCRYPEGEPRDDFALIAMRIGVLALRQARGQLDGDVIRREADRMLSDLQRHLCKHANDIEKQVTGTFRDYFDPTNGRFHERVERLIKPDGELELLLRAHVGNHDSELCKTLTAHIGEQSPLIRKLSPEQQDGLLAILQRLVETELRSQSEAILSQFSLDNQDGALSRLIIQLTEKHDRLGNTLRDRVNDVIAELSLDDEQSFFSRLQRTLDKTSETINNNLTLDDDNSSLARLQREVRKILAEHSESNQRFQEEVKTALAKMSARREELAASTRHGMVFEDAVSEYLHLQAQQRGDVLERTGNRVGLIKNCKVGDFIWELGPDSAAFGAKVAIESKEEQDYALVDARKEISQARDNRGAQVGLFIFSSRTAPPVMECFSRLGDDVYVVWDAEDSSTDIYLKAGLEVARALCLKSHAASEAQAADFTVIDAAILEIEKRANSLEDVAKWAETIRSNAEKIIERATRAREAIQRQISGLQERMADLKQTVHSA